ncbi:elicitin [Phytophthora sojae]|uniref:Elicitin n=2 Tax=Phytophthora sojae TaxID=67593 RepID=G5A2R8_PHYSP|nr:elicitin [Phytophthora sojae]ABB56007.1 elicitin-like protein SOL11F [Phytophthora sojae]EGZ09958.1 elicitin [Phytophthora sojae]|eukprot:XP_009534819.1 elicitin [Phytophthora sojae]
MKAAISSLLLAAFAVTNAANCGVSKLAAIANSADASSCKLGSNFVVPVESTVNAIVTNLESFCADESCGHVLEALQDIGECSIDGEGLRQSVVNPIKAVCSATRALRAADGSHQHGSTMEISLGSMEMEDSHDATSSSTATESSEMEDSHDIASSASGSAAAGDDDDHDSHDTVSSTATSSTGSIATSSAAGSSTGGATTGSKATSSNSTSSTQAPSASSTSSAGSVSVALGSVVLAVAAAFA